MSVPSTQKVLYLPALNQGLVVETGDVYKPGPGELLVKIEAVALNPADWKNQQFGFFVESYPYIPGLDSAGVVAAVGEGVNNFIVGDRVLHQGGWAQHKLATFQQYTTIHQGMLI